MSNPPLASKPRPAPAAAPLLQPRRILVRGVNWLGDAVMTTPALQRLRERFPEAHITLLTQDKLAPLWRQHPSLDNILSLPPGESPWSVARRLRAEAFDLALVLPNSPRSALETWLAGIPQRTGYARPWRNWFLTHPVAARSDHVEMRKRPVREIQRLVRSVGAEAHSPRTTEHAPRNVHHIHQYLHLVASLGASSEPLPPLLTVAPEELSAAAAKFQLEREPAHGRPVFGLNPGAEYGPAKRWPLERFIAAAQEIQRRTNCLWLLLGGPSDVPAATALHSAIRNPQSAILLAGQTSLRELMALLKLCRVLLTNDTGPMHVAAALGTPVVVPFGSTSPELTGPGLPGQSRRFLLTSTAPCAPCFRRVCPIDFRCMTGIGVEAVVEAVLEASLCPKKTSDS
jgi:heptosyltransferase II